MSLLWRDRIAIGIEPGAVRFSRQRGGWRARLIEQDHIRCETGGSDDAWRQPVVELMQKLQRRPVPRSVCRIVLSDQLVRYLLVPWSAQLQSRQDRLRLAQARFRAVYGDVADAWEVSLDSTGYGAATLACAADHALLRELRELRAVAGIRVASIRSHLAAAFNCLRRELRAPEFWFALVEHGHLWLGRFERDNWVSTSSYRLGPQPVAEVLESLEREAVLAGRQSRGTQVYLAAAGLDRDSLRALRDTGVSVIAAQAEGFVGSGINAVAAARK